VESQCTERAPASVVAKRISNWSPEPDRSPTKETPTPRVEYGVMRATEPHAVMFSDGMRWLHTRSLAVRYFACDHSSRRRSSALDIDRQASARTHPPQADWPVGVHEPDTSDATIGCNISVRTRGTGGGPNQ
jgi:hypothetical protein